MFKMWGGFVFILYSLLQLNVQTAEAYIGNSRGWSSRDLSLRRPQHVDPMPNPTVLPIHHIPRPLPKPVEIQRGKSAVASQISEIVPVEPRSDAWEREQPSTRVNYPTRPQRVVLQRKPSSWSPSPMIVPSLPIDITKPSVADPSAPSVTSKSIVDESNSEVIALEVPVPQPLYEERVISSKDILQEESASAEDIEVILPIPAPSGRSNRHFLMARPLPRPSNIQPVKPTMAPTVAPTIATTVAPTIAPTVAPTVAPEGSVTILKEEPVPEPEEKPIEILPEVIVLPDSMPEETSSGAAISSSPSEEPAVKIEKSIPKKEIYPKISEPFDDEILYILEEEEVVEDNPDVPDKLPPTMTVIPMAEPPTSREYALIPSVSNAPTYRRPLNRRPLTRKPVLFLPTTPQPSVGPITSRKPIIGKTLFPPTVTATPLTPSRRPLATRKPIIGKTLIPPTATSTLLEPSRPPINTRKPIMGKTLIPPTVTVPSSEPPRLITTRKPTLPPKIPATQGKGLIPPPRQSTPAPTQLMDYPCTSESKFHGIANDCDSYVECEASIATMYTCPDGLHYNPRAIWPEYPCGYPWEVKCDSNALRREPQPTEDCPRQYGLFPVLNTDCSKYIICQEGIATVMNCPPGLVFNTNTNSCDWPANVPSCNPDVFQGFTCPAPPLEEDGTPSDMILKYRFGQSCKEYIACQLGHPRLLRCDSGLYFDEISEICVDSEYVQNCRP